jgi:hypothetical protein
MKARAILTAGMSSVEPAVSALLLATEIAQPVRWIEFPASILLFATIPDDPESGAFHVFDRMTRTWLWIDFEDAQYGGYTIRDFFIHSVRPISKSPSCSPSPRLSGTWDQEGWCK